MKPNAWILMRFHKWSGSSVGFYLMMEPGKSIGYLKVFKTKKDALDSLKDLPADKRKKYGVIPVKNMEVK